MKPKHRKAKPEDVTRFRVGEAVPVPLPLSFEAKEMDGNTVATYRVCAVERALGRITLEPYPEEDK